MTRFEPGDKVRILPSAGKANLDNNNTWPGAFDEAVGKVGTVLFKRLLIGRKPLYLIYVDNIGVVYSDARGFLQKAGFPIGSNVVWVVPDGLELIQEPAKMYGRRNRDRIVESFDGFLNEAKKGKEEVRIVYSPVFRDALRETGDEVAKMLLELEGKVIPARYTYIDIDRYGVRAVDTQSYGFDQHRATLEQDWRKFKEKGRTDYFVLPEVKIGRVVKDLLGDSVPDSARKGMPSVENFIHNFNNRKVDTSFFRILRRDAISYWYWYRRYKKGHGPLNKSCMRRKLPYVFRMYEKSPDTVGVLALFEKNELDLDTKLMGRAMFWKALTINGRKVTDKHVVDRIYTVRHEDRNKFIRLMKDKGWFGVYSGDGTYRSASTIIRYSGKLSWEDVFKRGERYSVFDQITGEEPMLAIRKLPWVDSMRYMYPVQVAGTDAVVMANNSNELISAYESIFRPGDMVWLRESQEKYEVESVYIPKWYYKVEEIRLRLKGVDDDKIRLRDVRHTLIFPQILERD